MMLPVVLPVIEGLFFSMLVVIRKIQINDILGVWGNREMHFTQRTQRKCSAKHAKKYNLLCGSLRKSLRSLREPVFPNKKGKTLSHFAFHKSLITD
jgi:hypothetical protein